MFELKDKVALVTGSGQGIGRAIAQALAGYGAKIALVDIQKESLETTARHLDSMGAQTLSIEADISQLDSVQHMITQITHHWGRLDILVNNAGILRDATILKMNEESFDQVVAVNLKGVFLCGQAAALVMSKQKHGKIINVSSIARQGNFGQSNYSATKAGVAAMTRTWALELSRFNINVNAVAPGLIATEMMASIPSEIREKMVAQIPLKRPGEPREVADLVCFLASDKASYIQGEVITISGGFTL